MLSHVKKNRSEIEGHIKSTNKSSRENFYEIEVILESIKNVEGYVNFLTKSKNDSITIFVSQQALEQNRIEVDKKIICKVRLTPPPPRIFINPKYIQIMKHNERKSTGCT